MSDYNGPSQQVRVRFTREWCGVPEGHECEATWYPALGTYYVPVLRGQHIGGHPKHHGLLAALSTPAVHGASEAER